MSNLTRPVLIAAIAGVVAIAAIAVAAWRLSSVGGPLPGMSADGGAVTGSAPAPSASAVSPAPATTSPAAPVSSASTPAAPPAGLTARETLPAAVTPQGPDRRRARARLRPWATCAASRLRHPAPKVALPEASRASTSCASIPPERP